VRLPHGRHHHAAPAVRVGLHQARHSATARGRRHQEPDRGGVTQAARNLAYDLGTRLEELRFLIRDRDTKFTAAFDAVFATDGMHIITSPVQAPQANAVCERLIGTLRREVLDRLLILNHTHLMKILNEYHAAR
jgi:putative transposase